MDSTHTNIPPSSANTTPNTTAPNTTLTPNTTAPNTTLKANTTAPNTTTTPNTTDSATGKAPKGFWFFVTFMVLTSTLGSFVNDMFTPALPAMCRFFHTSIPSVQMGLTMGMIGLAIGQLILGPVSDHVGRKPVLIGSLSLFIVAAVVSVFSPSIHFFVWCRLFQGMGAAGGYFLARTMPADLYSGRQLAKIMALIGGINGFAPASAPVLGGFTADAFGWKGIFVALAILAAVIVALTPWLHESLTPDRRTVGSIFRSFGGYLELLKNRHFMVHVAFKGVALGILFAYISSSPFILQDHYGFSQTIYGLIIGGNAIFVVAGSMLALKFKPLKRAAGWGTRILAVGAAALAVSLWLVKSFWLYEVCMAAILFGLGLIFTTTNTLSMNEGRARAGEASALLGIAGYIVGAVVSPLVGMGNVLHSTAITTAVTAALVVVCAIASCRIAPDLGN